MRDPNLAIVAQKIQEATKPEDLFGLSPAANIVATIDEKVKVLHKLWIGLLKYTAPDLYDKNPEDKALANVVTVKLHDLYNQGVSELKAGTYGIKKEVVLTAQGQTYTLGKKIATGAICNIYECGKDVVKICKVAKDNDLMVAEKEALNNIFAFLVVNQPTDQRSWMEVLPDIKHAFFLDVDKDKHKVHVLTGFENMITLKDVIAKIGKIDARTSGWLWKRIITFLPWAHFAGFVHNAILPPHLLLRPDNYNDNTRDPMKHAVVFIDWCYSRPVGKPAVAIDAQYKTFYPPEVLLKKPLTGATDLYMAAKTLLYAIGGNVTTNTFPDDYPAELKAVIEPCLNIDPNKRPAFDLVFKQTITALEAVFGPPKWHNFIVK
jgi:hypothetical protein